ncbi:tubulin-tyrosine ligase family-domain-containing protein [Pavlovales sp. CCMP2436]|nr:tubulin-tyrosine ligase family-domain-containing protein [Pavlovales sp. CCMP2436]
MSTLALEPACASDVDLATTPCFVNRDVEGSTSLALAVLLATQHGFTQLPADTLSTAAAAASIYLVGPNDAVPWTQLDSGGLTIVNRIRGYELLCRKSKLARLLRTHPAQPHPQTFVLHPEPLRKLDEPGLSALQLDKRRTFAADDERERAALLAADAALPSAWIVKDAQGAKGDNIAVCASAAAAIDEAESGRHSTAVVVQRYLREPLLLPGGRKFDIRLWVLVDPEFRFFIHRQGVCRTSSSKYDPESLEDTLGHITNHCVQERGADFAKFEAGNELFFAEFDQVLRSTCGMSLSDDVWPQLRCIVRAVAEAAHESLAPPPTRGGVRGAQLFGFDFMVDAGKKVHLLEVNGSPAIADTLRLRISTDMASLLLAALAADAVLPAPPAITPRSRPVSWAITPTTQPGSRAATPVRAGTPFAADAAVQAAAGEFVLVFSP